MASGTALPNLGLVAGFVAHDTGWGANGFEPNMDLLDAVVFLSVKSAAIATPPGSPAAGDRYVVAASPTGAWSGHAKDLAIYRASAWHFYTPKLSWRAWNEATSVFIRFDGTNWVNETTGFSATVTSPASNDFILYNGSSWVNVTHTVATAVLDAVVGDSGSGGTKGLVPAATTGDTAAGKVLSASGSFGVGDPVDAFIRANPPPVLSNWTQINISSPAAAADSAAGPVITQTAPGSGPNARILWKSLAAYPQDFTADFVLALDLGGADRGCPSGVLLGRSSVSTMHGYGVRFTSGFPEMGDHFYSSTYTTISSGDRALCWPNFQRLCFRLRRASTSDTTYFYHSADMVTWNRFGQSSYFVYAANRIGFFLDVGAGDGTSTGGPDKMSSITLLAYRYTNDP